MRKATKAPSHPATAVPATMRNYLIFQIQAVESDRNEDSSEENQSNYEAPHSHFHRYLKARTLCMKSLLHRLKKMPSRGPTSPIPTPCGFSDK